MDYKDKIIESLEILRIRDIQSGEKFSALAYLKAIKELKKLDTITSEKDVEIIPGVGTKIKLKIKEILKTGELKAATQAKADLQIDLYQDLLNVYGIGPVKAKELIQEEKVKSIADLRTKQTLLNEKQKLGLKYYEDSLERIPREEMVLHERKIKEIIKAPFEGTIVGSYRRGAANSGDIDVLIKIPADYTQKQQKDTLETLVEKFKEDYITDVLALGDKKCMAFVKLADKARRLDLLITSEKEYPYALLYFTGSDDFNVEFRKYALTKGYTLNEHILIKKSPEADEVPEMKTEKDIFDFLGLKYKEPNERINENSVVKKLTMSEAMKEKKKLNKKTTIKNKNKNK